jgi:hypothetical protein
MIFNVRILHHHHRLPIHPIRVVDDGPYGELGGV